MATTTNPSDGFTPILPDASNSAMILGVSLSPRANPNESPDVRCKPSMAPWAEIPNTDPL